MKQVIFIFTFLCCYQILYSQNNIVCITGKVTAENSNRKIEAVKDALVHLKLSNGEMLEYKSNDTGYYFFNVKPFQGIGELTIATDKFTTFISSKSDGFLASINSYTFGCSESQSIVKDLCLSVNPGCILNSPPRIYFKQNSKKPICKNDSLYNKQMSPKEAINFFYEVMTSNPEIVAEIKGHSDSNEKHQEKLSLKRSKYVAKEIIKKGIDKGRIKTIGERNFQTLLNDNDKKTTYTPEEIEKLHQQNRRVVFRIVSWDYIPKEKNTPTK